MTIHSVKRSVHSYKISLQCNNIAIPVPQHVKLLVMEMVGEPTEHVLELCPPNESGYSSRRGKKLTQVQYAEK